MKVPDLPEGLLLLERNGPIPLSQQIYRAIREAVRRGVLTAGIRLPSSRRLAEQLDVSRNTVNAAYELLKGEQIVDCKAGAAPVVRRPEVPEGAVPREVPETPVERRLSQRGERMSANLRGSGWANGYGAMQPGSPALDVFPRDLWARSLRRAARQPLTPELLYRHACGHPKLVDVMADYLSSKRGVRAEGHSILITGSMQAALSCLSEVLADQGDSAWIEDPGYLGARSAFYAAGLNVRGIPVDGEGIDLTSIQSDCAPPKLIYVSPSHHYPLGYRMSLSRRLALIEMAKSMGATILEDDYDSEFLFEGRPIAALQGLAYGGEVIYLGTFSKSLLPGLRVAYCVVPDSLASPLRQALRNSGRLANVQTQLALADFILDGHYETHLKKIRTVYQTRGQMLVDRLRGRLGNRVCVDEPTGNVQLAIGVREACDDEALAVYLQGQGYSVSPLSRCFLDREPQSGLIAGFAGASPAQIDGFVTRLGQGLDRV